VSEPKTPYWTMKDYARHYDVTYQTVKDWKRKGALPVVPTPGRVVRLLPPGTTSTNTTAA
jgi:predicted site-specific integrase-resolvase